MIIAGSTPPTQGMLCALVKKRLKVPFVYTLQDIFPDSMVNARMTSKGSIIWRIGRKIEDYTYRNADKIIVISKDFKQNIMDKGVPEEKIVIIPNWVDTSSVYPIERKDNVLFSRYNIPKDKYYICYNGNIGHSQDMGVLLGAAKILKGQLSGVRFILVGDGAEKEEVSQRIDDENIDNVIMLPFQPYEDIAHVFSLGDAGLIISKPGIGGSSVPSKTWGIMAAGRPILCCFDLDSELSKLVERVDCGITAKAGDIESLMQAVRWLYGNRNEAADKGKCGWAYVKNNASKDVCTSQYIAVIRGVAGASKDEQKSL